ncbi:MAG: T9SS type A sorting domain-containing protein [Ignavibacteriaceae bacterium]|nr:T9SS type A sorting domain-containing protein [Ignavibacteriaceae bacterium]
MKKILLLLTVLIAFSLTMAQTAKIKNEPITPHALISMNLTSVTNSVYAGLDIVPNGTFVYASPQNIGNTEPITNATFQILSQPAGGTAAITVFNGNWVYFKPNVVGAYQVKLTITTASGTDDTTKTYYASNYVGVGNFQGVAGAWPKCMSCHAGMPAFAAIYDKWKVSGHANVFNVQLSTSTHYSTSCMKCHTTGYDHNVVSNNGGFDDVAASLGWQFYGQTSTAKWDSLVTYYPTLVNLATIGCESCHGAGSQHANGGSTTFIEISNEAGNCAQCHDEPWRHNIYSMYENSTHAEAVWSNSFAQGASSQNNSLSNCIRCHDAKGFINFTKGLTTNTTGMNAADHVAITCAACHDPHGNEFESALRPTPAGSDTLANGYQYTEGGKGQICMNCHKARANNVTYVQTGVTSSHWGPHHSTQTDNLLGKNAAEFNGVAYQSNAHKFAIANLCVDCHMVATVDTGSVNRDKVGGHSWTLHNSETDFYHTAACVNCHGPKTNWNDFMAIADHDGDGNIESIPNEVDGLIEKLIYYLPPAQQDTVIYSQVTSLDQKKAYFNYQLIAYDGSKGMHNSKFAIDVLTKSIIALGGVIPVELISFTGGEADNMVTLSWETATETNNRGFNIERRTSKVWENVGFVNGNGTSTEVHGYTFSENVSNISGTSVYYRLKQVDFDGTASYSKEIEITIDGGPKEFSLSQNYPNPFNPATIIKYNVPFQSNVKIVVYNLMGEVVTELVNAVKGAGYHEARFDAVSKQLASGVYLYRIEASAIDGSKTFKQTKKMVLMK